MTSGLCERTRVNERESLTELESGVWSPGGPGGLDFGRFSANLGPENPPDRRGLSYSAGCTKNQPRRLVLRTCRGHVLVLPDSRLHAKVWQGELERDCDPYTRHVYT